MLHSWSITLAEIYKQSNLDPKKVLVYDNYGKEKLTRINEKAGARQPDFYPLRNPRNGKCNIAACELFNITVDSRILHPINAVDRTVLRPYQVTPLTNLITKPYGLLHAEVGFGKTVCTAWIVGQLKGKTVILTNTIINAQQLQASLEAKFPWQVGIYYWKTKEFKDITVVVYASYKKFLSLYNGQRDITIFDEWHLLIKDTYRNMIIDTECQYKYTMTGTPNMSSFKYDDFKKFRWRIIPAEEYSELLRSQFEIKVTAIKLVKEFKEYRDFIHLKQLTEENPEKLDVISRIAKKSLSAGKKILIITDRAETSKRIGEALDVPFVTATTTQKKRNEIMLQFEQKRVLVATRQILWVGFDNPAVDTVIVCFSGREEANVIQASGRALRAFEWKQEVNIYDIVDNTGMMINQRYARKRAYQKYTDNFTTIDMKDHK